MTVMMKTMKHEEEEENPRKRERTRRHDLPQE
jgi:hypothetical protein